MNDQWDALWINGLLATCEQGYGLIEQGAIAVKDGKIAWIGETKAITARDKSATQIYDLQGRCLTPGLIDCHTHLIFGGNRAQEFAERLQGVSYEDIARRGGGIQSTVSATRLMSEEELLQVSLQRAKALLASGVTTLEIKSGYGLDLATEIKILRVAKQIETLLPITIYKTFLGAHTLPHEYRDQAEAYLDLVCEEMLPVIAQEKLAEAVDVFCEKIAFNLTQT
ncbi:MAG: amidohydrolase family protein, partial [Gammaproteobacteria bacterium]|nr:amidohydrolase family protein [Gammaproteobacteria bacterium]